MRIARAAAAAVVLALLGLLVWDVTHSGKGGVASKVDHGRVVAAPSTSLPYFGGRTGTFDLTAYRGKVVVLNFWASWCVECKLEAKTLRDAAAKWGGKVVFVGVDGSDLTSAARRYMERYDVTYPVVRDVGGSAQSAWGVTGFPETFFVDPQGRVVPPHVNGPIPASDLDAAIRRALAS
jgi:cytochrome c biogenesis protein CcmG, thiol:disulfide interchange protein DsbE